MSKRSRKQPARRHEATASSQDVGTTTPRFWRVRRAYGIAAAAIGLISGIIGIVQFSLSPSAPNVPELKVAQEPSEKGFAYLRLKAVREEEVWDEAHVFKESVTSTTENATSSRPYIYERVVTFAEESKVIDVKYKCSGQGCPWCYNPHYKPGTPHPEPMIEYSPSFEIRKEGREVVLTRYCDGSPSTLEWFIHYVKRVTVRAEEDFPPIEVAQGETFDILLPARTIDWSITGELSSGERITAKKGNTGPFLETVSIEPVGAQQRLVIRFSGRP